MQAGWGNLPSFRFDPPAKEKNRVEDSMAGTVTLFNFTHQLFIMQLPRGKFRSVIKGVALNSLIQELAEVRYTGVVTITRKHETISLVIQRGRYILAEQGSLRGNPAWEGIHALGETIIDAILADFSDAEVKLAIEFNEPSVLSSPIVTRVFKAQGEKGKEPGRREKPAGPPPEAPSPPLPKVNLTLVPEKSPESPAVWTKSDVVHAIATVSDRDGGGASPPGDYDELALLHMEMSSLDDVDVEHIATKIRKNAKGIVKKLHLGHLMTEKED
jgi:hypothetical protein